MNGSGARDGSLPPWGPADPVPGARDTQEVRGLGNAAEAGPGAGPGGQTGADPDAPDGPAGPAGGRRRRSFWRELPVLVVIALVLALVIKSFVIQAFYIPSRST